MGHMGVFPTIEHIYTKKKVTNFYALIGKSNFCVQNDNENGTNND